MIHITTIPDCACELGESPLWSESENALYFVDVVAPALCRYMPDSGRCERWAFSKPIASVALTTDARLLLVFRTRLALFDPVSNALVDLSVRPLDPDERYNDARCDAQGRLWVGTFDRTMTRPLGKLYCLTGTRLRCVDEGFKLSNGIAFSPDQTVLYFTDTQSRVIHAYDFHSQSGEVTNRREHIRFDGRGRPDGCAMDDAGNLWVAVVDAGDIIQFDQGAAVRNRITLNVLKPTSCVFGGARRDRLYVTSMRHGLTPEELEAQPMAGHTFAVDGTMAHGIAEGRFRP